MNDEDSNHVEFIHQSVNDYLNLGVGLGRLLPTHTSSNPGGYSYEALKTCCMNYMNSIVSTVLEEALYEPTAMSKIEQEWPFLDYAATNALIHASQADNYGVSQQEPYSNLGSQSARILYLVSAHKIEWAGQRLERLHAHRGMPALYIATSFYIESWMGALIRSGCDVNARGGHFGYALVLAAFDSYQRGVEILLEAGANPNIGSEVGQDGSPLWFAVNNGDKDIVRELLSYGADPLAPTSKYGSALSKAFREGHDDITQLLLDKVSDAAADESLGAFLEDVYISDRTRHAAEQWRASIRSKTSTQRRSKGQQHILEVSSYH